MVNKNVITMASFLLILGSCWQDGFAGKGDREKLKRIEAKAAYKKRLASRIDDSSAQEPPLLGGPANPTPIADINLFAEIEQDVSKAGHYTARDIGGILGSARGGCGFTLQMLREPRADGETILHVAASMGGSVWVGTLIGYAKDLFGVDSTTFIDAKDGIGDTALHKAVKKGWLETVNTLCRNGAALAITNKEGLTPFGLAKSTGFQKVATLIAFWDIKRENFRLVNPSALTRANGQVAEMLQVCVLSSDDYTELLKIVSAR
jgi:hypothetical protein